jgi:hypothetical protein
MKELIDGTKVPSRTYYYLLEWNEFDGKQFIVTQFSKQRLCELNRVEYKRLLNKATTYDCNSI